LIPIDVAAGAQQTIVNPAPESAATHAVIVIPGASD
jgi:hypothetical protein